MERDPLRQSNQEAEAATPAWLHSLCVLAGAICPKTPPGTGRGSTLTTRGLVEIVAFPDVGSALAWAGLAAREGASVGLIAGVPSEATLARTAALAQRADAGQVLATLSVQDLARDAGDDIVFADIGTSDLLDRKERLFALIGPNTRSGVREVMHPATKPFIGRLRELEALRKALDLSRLITVHGPPGIGKSALLRRLAAEQDLFPQVTVVDLRHVGHEEAVVPTICSALEVSKLPGESWLEALVNTLRARSCLLVLDNVERLTQSVRPIILRILADCPEVGLLVGSQRLLRLGAESRFLLEHLEVPSPAEHWTMVREYDAVALFEECARRVDPSFAVDERNAADTAMLCHRLDGIPLAIELAASKVKILSPRQIVHRLDDRFLLLKDSSGVRTLEQTIRWSYELLSPDAQRLLRRLSVFAGAFALEWAEAICADAELSRHTVVNAFEELVDCSLLTAARLDAREKLFFLNETLRSFAASELRRSGEQDRLASRHAEWCLSLAHTAAAALAGDEDPTTLMLTLDAAFEDVRQVIRKGAEPKGNAEVAAETLVGCFNYFVDRNYYSEGLHLAERLIRTKRLIASEQYPRLLNVASSFAQALDLGRDARLHATASLRIARARKHLAQQAAAWSCVSLAHRVRLDHRRAAKAALRSAALLRELGEYRRLVVVLGNATAILSDLGDYGAAEKCLEEALGLSASYSDPYTHKHILINAAHIALLSGRYRDVVRYVWEAVRDSEFRKNRRSLNIAVRNAAYALIGLGDDRTAALLLGFARHLTSTLDGPEEPDLLEPYNRAMERLQSALGGELDLLLLEGGQMDDSAVVPIVSRLVESTYPR